MLFRINRDSDLFTHEKTLLCSDMMKPTKESAKVDNGPHIFMLNNNHSKWTKSRKTKCINIFQENVWKRMGLGTSFNWLNGFDFFFISYFVLLCSFFSSFSLFACSTSWWNQQIGEIYTVQYCEFISVENVYDLNSKYRKILRSHG